MPQTMDVDTGNLDLAKYREFMARVDVADVFVIIFISNINDPFCIFVI